MKDLTLRQINCDNFDAYFAIMVDLDLVINVNIGNAVCSLTLLICIEPLDYFSNYWELRKDIMLTFTVFIN